MKIYRPQDADVARHTVFVQPGREFPVSDWLDDAGMPRLFAVEFRAGRAEVDEHLGHYMIDHGLAQASALLLPAGAGLKDRHAGQNAG